MARRRGEPKASHELRAPPTLLERTRRAAYFHGYRGKRELSEFICKILQTWLDNDEPKLKDERYPPIPEI